MHRLRFALVVLLAVFATGATAATGVKSRWWERFYTRHVSSEGYEATFYLPDGWSVDPDQRVLVPSDENLAACRIRFDIYRGVPFRQGLAAGLRHDKESTGQAYRSELARVSGAEAVWVWYTDRQGNGVGRTYIDRSTDQSARYVVWQFDIPRDAGANDCDRDFEAIVRSSDVNPVEK
ncbi:MAG TPA: hypothetical protein VNN25_26905 [Thermoanaerobaculia bacterium]|nr:hypothetical protein [Thermoanaerobaculia bacterium]